MSEIKDPMVEKLSQMMLVTLFGRRRASRWLRSKRARLAQRHKIHSETREAIIRAQLPAVEAAMGSLLPPGVTVTFA